MLYSVAAAVGTCFLFFIGTAFLLVGVRILSGPSASYDLNRGVSKSFWGTVWGEVARDDVDGETRVMRGIGYVVEGDKIRLHQQAKLNRDAIHEVSEKSE